MLPQVIGKLAGTCRLHLAETHQLIAEAMRLEQPKLFAVQVGSTDYLVVEEGVFARHVGKELFIEQRRLLQLFHTCQTRYDTCIYFSRLQGFLDVVCFHFDYPDVEGRGISSSAAERNGAGGKELRWEVCPA